MIDIKIDAGWLREELKLKVSTEAERQKAVKTLEGFIHSLPHKLKEYNESLEHMYVEYTDTYICHTVCQDEYEKMKKTNPTHITHRYYEEVL